MGISEHRSSPSFILAIITLSPCLLGNRLSPVWTGRPGENLSIRIALLFAHSWCHYEELEICPRMVETEVGLTRPIII
ncbi:hypothetical protein BDP55DRAFT_666426 [Colletotrichum godetiae]|uniref:Secreted protein n=1 Tax=Colletotrichum godetiae TaxID=1209918 RepID=A0AAJ0EX36_9PEZI|nr:uncharacterized protein BDP55DRAFT_666426 [Colletotrichum godetiae]KAK1674829.1 hypothetical protein BDP55DRAFT_666426 [Colletotrichum godetiae]